MAHAQRKPFPGRTVPGLSPGKQALKTSQAKDRATLGIGTPGGLTRQGLNASLAGLSRSTGRVKTFSLPARRDPFQEANKRLLEAGKPALSRAASNAAVRS